MSANAEHPAVRLHLARDWVSGVTRVADTGAGASWLSVVAFGGAEVRDRATIGALDLCAHGDQTWADNNGAMAAGVTRTFGWSSLDFHASLRNFLAYSARLFSQHLPHVANMPSF